MIIFLISKVFLVLIWFKSLYNQHSIYAPVAEIEFDERSLKVNQGDKFFYINILIFN